MILFFNIFVFGVRQKEKKEYPYYEDDIKKRPYISVNQHVEDYITALYQVKAVKVHLGIFVSLLRKDFFSEEAYYPRSSVKDSEDKHRYRIYSLTSFNSPKWLKTL